MPKSISTNLGASWNYLASKFPPIGGQQRLVLLKLREGPLFFASFADEGIMITDASGAERRVRGLYAALSEDGGETWPYKRLITDDGTGTVVETTAAGLFLMSPRNAEWRGYMTCCQAPNGVIHLLTSRQHYAFNLAWVRTPSPPLQHPPVKVMPATETFDGPDNFDCTDWADYHAYRGGFNGKGQYAINALGPLGGINRIIGEGSFETTIKVDNIAFNPTARPNPPGLTLWLKDDRVRTLLLNLKKRDMTLELKDKKIEPPQFDTARRTQYSSPPKSLTLKLIYDEDTRQVRAFYGFDGAQPGKEMPESRAGLYFGEALTESAAIYLLFSSGSMDLDHFEVKPVNP
jgi:hypothetical protein